MGLFKKIASFFSGDSESDDHVYEANVRCNRCRELLTLVGSNRCFQRVEVTLYFDERRNLVDRQISGGEFIEPEPDANAASD
jgi:hypothetical protein